MLQEALSAGMRVQSLLERLWLQAIMYLCEITRRIMCFQGCGFMLFFVFYCFVFYPVLIREIYSEGTAEQNWKHGERNVTAAGQS